MKLYEIKKEIEACVDIETGEIIDEQKLNDLSLKFDEKVENIALWIKNLRAESTALKEEKAAFEKRQKQVDNKIKSLTNFLAYLLNGSEFETTKAKLTFRRSEAVEILDESMIPADYMRMQDPVPDKTAIRQDLKSGKSIPGCMLKENYSLQIK